jgi:hypothetical protein
MDNKSRMSREAHVRFCEKLGLQCPCLLDYFLSFTSPHHPLVRAAVHWAKMNFN